MLQELQIQSNLPLIILTILVICIVVIGYLELKKVHNSIDTLNNRFDTLKKNETPKIDMIKYIIPDCKNRFTKEAIIIPIKPINKNEPNFVRSLFVVYP